MIYYKVKCKYTMDEKTDITQAERFWNSIHRGYIGGESYKLFIISHDETYFNAVLIFSVKDHSLTSIKEKVRCDIDCSKKLIKSVSFVVTPEEITVSRAISLIRKGKGDMASLRSAVQYCEADYMSSHSDLQFDECVLPHSKVSYEEVTDEAHNLLADISLNEELERIYSPLNKRKFYGNPVNYKINAVSRETAKNLVELLTKALYTNKRILSTRVAYITKLDDSYDDALEDLCNNSYASVVAIECNDADSSDDRFARGREAKCEYICNIVRKFSSQTVFILIDLGSKVCKQSVSQLVTKDDICFIEIFEGKGDSAAGKKYLKSLLKDNKVPYAKEDFVLPEQAEYNVSDIVTAYKEIKKNSIRNSVYKAYKEVKVIKPEAPKTLSDSYDKLQKMVGLTEIKVIIDQIISAQKVNKLRLEMGLDVAGTAKHMIFTGNPGSAKTTVARLLASILYDEHVLEKNRFIECGRQDLVGKFVGWTAKQVEEQFRRARGGILFIDEAYSLVEKEGYYGDEAINTIVQMMENYRNDVIVIFAGYPDKMEKFLAKNEGLRSRIAFHVDFPDYNAEELCGILKLMSEDKGYTLDDSAEEKCRAIFEIACKNAEFGNGRFVRNVLEQAIIKQSLRIVDEYQNENVDKKIISVLSASDFEINAAETYKTTEKVIGF
jgi:Holliday junction resolvasome RuvABC ATP-dependent DNA helicase subunit